MKRIIVIALSLLVLAVAVESNEWILADSASVDRDQPEYALMYGDPIRETRVAYVVGGWQRPGAAVNLWIKQHPRPAYEVVDIDFVVTKNESLRDSVRYCDTTPVWFDRTPPPTERVATYITYNIVTIPIDTVWMERVGN